MRLFVRAVWRMSTRARTCVTQYKVLVMGVSIIITSPQLHAYPDINDKGGSLIHLVVYEKFINKLIYLSITISFVGVFYIRNKLFLCVCLCGCECFIQYRLFLRGCVSWLRQINETKTTKECRQRVIRCLFVVRFYHISNVFALVAAQGWARLDQY